MNQLNKRRFILNMIKFITTILFLITIINSKYMPAWGQYVYKPSVKQNWNKGKKEFVDISHPLLQKTIFISNRDMKQQYNYGNEIVYSIGSRAKMTVNSEGQYLDLRIENKNGKDVQIEVMLANIQEQEIGGQFKEKCIRKSNSYMCKIPFSMVINKEKQGQKKQNSNSNETSKLQNFMKTYKIQNKYKQITIKAISQLINSICVKDSTFGFCDKTEYNVKLSALSIQVLASFDYQLAKYIYLSYIDYLQTQLIYTNHHEGQCLPFPQRIEVINKFQDLSSQEKEVVQALLNNYFIIPMLNKLSTLQQQVNYRENKKLHPYLVQMLTQKWNKHSHIQGLKSIYGESFTQDFKYHDYGFTLYSSPSKSAWLYKVIQEFGSLLLQKQRLRGKMSYQDAQQEYQEIYALLNIMKTYISDEENAKKGSYLPIVLSPNNEMRLFSKYVGYDSLLPYVYRAGAVMPKNALMSLISPNGIKSCNIESYSENYRYRGDIHSYFNYIIINGFKERILQDMKKNPTQEHTETLSILKNVVESLKKNIMKGFNEDNKIYTSWSPEGQGKQQIGWLKIINILILSLSM